MSKKLTPADIARLDTENAALFGEMGGRRKRKTKYRKHYRNKKQTNKKRYNKNKRSTRRR